MPTPQELLERLKAVKYPGFSRDIVSFGVVRDIEVASTGVTVVLQPTSADETVAATIEQNVRQLIEAMSDVAGPVTIQRVAAPAARQAPRGPQAVPGIGKVIAVASGKGGVGKSTVATNLALALASMGRRIGLMDADVYGPSVSHMLGITAKSRAGDGGRLTPIEAHGIRAISMAMFVQDGAPIIWRGPMLTKLITEFLRNCDWGDLDVLVIDLPPGTGDVQLTLTQQLPITGGIVVTTPQDVALADVRRGIQMFRQVKAPVLGIVENMSFHLCPGCGTRADIYGHGGGGKMAEEFGVPLLGEVPLVRAIREAGDAGTPIVVRDPSHPQSRAFQLIAERTLVRLASAEQELSGPQLRVVQ